MVIKPITMLRITANLTNPLPNLELINPVSALVKATAKIVIDHLAIVPGTKVIAINGNNPPAAAANKDAKAASHGFK